MSEEAREAANEIVLRYKESVRQQLAKSLNAPEFDTWNLMHRALVEALAAAVEVNLENGGGWRTAAEQELDKALREIDPFGVVRLPAPNTEEGDSGRQPALPGRPPQSPTHPQ